jgi:hypothetical protein
LQSQIRPLQSNLVSDTTAPVTPMKKHNKAPEWPGDVYDRLPPNQQKLIRKMLAKVSAKMKRGGLKLIQGGRQTSPKGGK